MDLPVCGTVAMGDDNHVIFWSCFHIGTIAELAARKQTYKLGMFRRLYRVLLAAVMALFVFFVVSSMSFSSRYEEGTRYLLYGETAMELSVLSRRRLYSQILEEQMVAARWLARPVVHGCIHHHSLLLASNWLQPTPRYVGRTRTG